MADGTAAPRHAAGPPARAWLVTAVPSTLLTDARLSAAARGLAVEALANEGHLDVAEVASRVSESVNEVLDAVQLLLEGGYAVLTGEVLTLTPAEGWPT